MWPAETLHSLNNSPTIRLPPGDLRFEILWHRRKVPVKVGRTFDVQLSGESMTVNSLSISSGDIVLALASTPSSINALRVVYTKHANTSRNIVDSAGNPVANFTHIPSNDSTPPTFKVLIISLIKVSGDKICSKQWEIIILSNVLSSKGKTLPS